MSSTNILHHLLLKSAFSADAALFVKQSTMMGGKQNDVPSESLYATQNGHQLATITQLNLNTTGSFLN